MTRAPHATSPVCSEAEVVTEHKEVDRPGKTKSTGGERRTVKTACRLKGLLKEGSSTSSAHEGKGHTAPMSEGKQKSNPGAQDPVFLQGAGPPISTKSKIHAEGASERDPKPDPAGWSEGAWPQR